MTDLFSVFQFLFSPVYIICTVFEIPMHALELELVLLLLKNKGLVPDIFLV
jgi:hypothetical protein